MERQARNLLTLLITGDNMMDPDLFREHVEQAFGKDKFNIKIKRYSFDNCCFPLEAQTTIPSGMCFEDPKVKMGYPDCGVNEFYGEPYSLMEDIRDVDILVIHGAALPRKVLENANRLKYIISLRGGPANIDMEYVRQHGIKLLNTNGKNAQAVAEFTLGALLDFERDITYGNAYLKNDYWWIKAVDDRMSHELQNKKFGFIGYGNIAQKLRKLLSGFDIEAYAYSPHINEETLEKSNVKRLSLPELVSTCDYVSLHTRPVKGQPPVMSAEMIGMMKSDAVLINSGRGALLDYAALKKALEKKRIRGAVLDVLGNEPFSFYKELLDMSNTLITPHIAGQSYGTCVRACQMGTQLLRSILGEE